MNAQLIYNKNSRPGVTVFSGDDATGYYPKGKDDNYDKSYPIDVRAFNSPEFSNFYGSNDFVGTYASFGAALGVGGDAGFIEGNLRGYGFVQYKTETSGGYNLYGWMISRGVITGRSMTGDFSPATLEGFGNQQGVGLEIFSAGTWGSFNSLSDALKNTNATFRGTFKSLGSTIGIQLRKSKLEFTMGITNSTLIKPVVKKP